jgi:hypothetical protein
LLIAFLAATALPLPRAFDACAGAGRAEQNARVRNAIDDAVDIGLVKETHHGSFSLTRNRAGTIKYILLAIAVGCVAAVSSRVSPEVRPTQMTVLVGVGAVLAAMGFVHQWLAASRTFWWWFPVQHGQPVGGFVSRTHFAGYIALLSPAAMALVYDAVSRRRLPAAAAWLAVTAGMAAVVVCSLSRGATVALAAGMIAVIVTAAFGRPLRDNIPAAVALLACVLFVTALVARPGILPERIRNQASSRLATLRSPLKTESAVSRLHVWRDSLRAWRNYPVVGAGASGFRMVYPQHRTRTDRPSFKQAENEYIQTLVDMGIAGVGIIAWIAVCVALAGARTFRTRSAPSAVLLAVPGVLTVFLVHSAVDFPARTPLYAMTLAWIIGMCLTSAPDARVVFRIKRRIALPAVLAVSSAILALGLWPSACGSLARDSSDRIQSAQADELSRMLVWSPTSWQTWYHMGRRACAEGTRPAIRFGERCMTQAAAYDPHNYRLWETIACLRREMGDTAGARDAAMRMKSLRNWKSVPPGQPETF